MANISSQTDKVKDFVSQIHLPKLPWPEDSLEPFISKETIQYHYGKHHAKYVEETNRLLKGSPLAGSRLETIITQSEGPLRNNAAQAWNHTFFWNCLTPSSQRRPSERLLARFNESFGEFKTFQRKFSEAAIAHFGSGWAWLVLDENQQMKIEAFSDAGNPLMARHHPLLALDVWEHAYYIDYRNDRKKFVENFWCLVDWDFVEINCFQKH